MWDWWCFFCFSNFNPTKYYYPENQNLLPLQHDQNQTTPPSPLSFSTMILTSCLSRRRFRRYLCLLLCSPFLLPLFCATFPFICAAEICYRLCHRRRRRRSTPWEEVIDGSSQGSLLLQRYLEDQLLLVYNCGCGNEDELEDGLDVQFIDSTSPILQ
ncbi:PREDICTED: uncharacterized protein LOC109211887 [Nicotiana attenuata]|uniref:Uncharacterized protein n=1 Tax=Nicotiana attenuata TaxID=49451 RepID=A0A314KI63_NICAT|nr:PREDICTED: uncharacterized protein LOC109211887 [Nicotiana attenuata]OIT29035.1 hypothetical protein A4A49_17528 [Nicotiana attenuata]